MLNLALLPLCLLFAVIGTIEDFIVSLYYIAIGEGRALRSAIISTIHTVLAIFVVATVIVSRSPWPLLFYALGGGVGTYCGVRHRNKK
jgi:uncharacterized membrane protein